MNMVEQVRVAIEQANQYRSKLPMEAFNFDDSYSGRKGRHLLNNLATLFKPYFEVGCYLGSTLIAASYDNPGLIVGIDTFVDATKPGVYMVDTRRRLLDRLSKYSDRARPSLIDASCWDLKPLGAFQCCFYDGDHTEQAQADALIKMYDWFTPQFTLVVDDYNRQNVRDGTRRGITERELRVDYEIWLGGGIEPPDDRLGWWNGMGVFVLSK